MRQKQYKDCYSKNNPYLCSRNMKVLNSIKLFAQKVLRAQATKYTVVCLLGVLIVGFLDENSIWSHFKNKQRISDLEEEIEK